MNVDSIKKLQYSYAGQNDFHLFPELLVDSIGLIAKFFQEQKSNKLCLVFPSKELAAQWISIPLTLDLLKEEFDLHGDDINEAYKLYRPGQRLLLNNEAIVEWVRGDKNNITFKTRGTRKKNYWENTTGTEITITCDRINNLRPANGTRKALSSQEFVYKNLLPKSTVAIDKLLGIRSNGNFLFQKKSICLVSRFKTYEESIEQIRLNGALITDYFKQGKIGDDGKLIESGPLVITNNFRDLALWLEKRNPVSKIIIDGYKAIGEKGLTDFSDLDQKYNLPTVLITDLSEIDTFESIENHGFNFFSFTRQNILPYSPSSKSPFKTLGFKLSKYASFKLENEVCEHRYLEEVVNKIQQIEEDDSDSVLTSIRISLIQTLNRISRITFLLKDDEFNELIVKIGIIENLFEQHKTWLGVSVPHIEKAISGMKLVLENWKTSMSPKCVQLLALMRKEKFNYLICVTDSEVLSLRDFLVSQMPSYSIPKIISIAEVNDNVLSAVHTKALLTGWPKATNFNRILSSFLFSKLTVILYQFEYRYFSSLQRRNLRSLSNIKRNFNAGDTSYSDQTKRIQFEEIFKTIEDAENGAEDDFDVASLELKMDDVQYSKYLGRPNSNETVKARRIDFDNETFLYAIEPHKFLVINELLDTNKRDKKILYKKTESLNPGDIIVLINTERDILVELVEKNTKPEELKKVKYLTDLWKNLLREYYNGIGCDFKKLVSDLRKLDCLKHESTIKTWLLDDNRIGPDDDLDLISIALLTNSEFLNDNISNVRKAIDQMISWRFQASDHVREKITSRLVEFADDSIVNTSVEIQDLGTTRILRISNIARHSQDIDRRFLNKVLEKED